MITRPVAARIVNAILADLHGRSGIGDAFENIDEDIQKEIQAHGIYLVMAGGLPEGEVGTEDRPL